MRPLVPFTSLLLLTLSANAQSDARYEAEEAELFGNATVATDRSGFSGSGYVSNVATAGDSLRFAVTSDAGFYQVRVATAWTGRFAPSFDVWVDGVEVTTLDDAAIDFEEALVVELPLDAGAHTITVQVAADVDYLRFGVAPSPATPLPRLSDPAASDATKALFAFLLDEYGRHVLSGQNDVYSGSPRTSEIDYVASTTGKEPAIGSFDLIEYSPTRVECGTGRSDWPAEWIEWATTGDQPEAIANLMWHWNAPTDLYDTDCNGPDEQGTDRNWYSGFYTEASSFNFAEALAQGPGGEDYDLLLRDIDAIADQLQTFEDADVPVLWRPLHEAAGGFFWWGAQTGADYVELWQLMYDRLVEFHGLHNLIWVWTWEPAQGVGGPLDWYPGDDYVDVVSRDFYSSDPEDLIRDEWDRIEGQFEGNKLVALSESGTLPDMEASTDRGIWWSWFSIWTGEFIRDMDADRLTQIYTSDVVLTRDELPDWRSYALSTAEADGPETPDSRLTLAPNPSAGPVTLRLDLDAAADVVVETFDALGRRVGRQSLGRRPAGPLAVRLAAPATLGTYLVRVTAGDRVVRGRFVVAR